jgi:hypothetical protein
MKLTVAYRDQPAAGFSGAKHHFVAFHTELSNAERAIIQERGLYDHFISVPSDTPPPTRGGDFLARSMRIIGIVITPIGILFALVAGLKPEQAGAANGGATGWFMIIAGVVIFTIGKIRDMRANKRESNPEQKLTFRRMLTNPDFVVYAPSLMEAKSSEAEVREALSVAAQSLRESVSVPDQTSYEL